MKIFTKKLNKMKKGQEPAFPVKRIETIKGSYSRNDGLEMSYTNNVEVVYAGMSTRLYLAGMAMQGMCANADVTKLISGNNGMPVCEEITKIAIRCADELIKMEEETR